MVAQNTFVGYTHIGPHAIVFAFPSYMMKTMNRICMIAPTRSITAPLKFSSFILHASHFHLIQLCPALCLDKFNTRLAVV